jgi:hypothetical protein
MPSLPEWAASLIELIRDEHQPGPDGHHRKVPTLPANSILRGHRRAEVEQHIADLIALCNQTPLASAEWEGTTLIVITDLMLALPSAQQSDVGAEASGKAFLMALDDVPSWAVAAGVRRWYRGECGETEFGRPYDYRFRPSPADLRRISLIEKWRVYGRVTILRRLVAAEPRLEFSEEHCQRMKDKLASLSSQLRSV